MPCNCLVQEGYHEPKLGHGGYHWKSLVRETYAHCRVPCLSIPAAWWISDEDTDDDDDALDTKQVILNEMRNREMKKQRARCSVDGGASSSSLPANTFFWSLTPLDPRGAVIHMGSGPEDTEAAGGADDDESEAFFSVKSFFTRSTSRAATVAWSSNDMYLPPSPATWGEFRNCEGWPFGLCRRRPTVPPLPSTPADSWKWRNRNSNRSGSLAVRPPGQSSAPAYTVTPTRYPATSSS